MELAPEKMSAGNKRANAVSQPASKRAKTTDSQIASQMGHFKLEGSPKQKNFTPTRKLALQCVESSTSESKYLHLSLNLCPLHSVNWCDSGYY